MLETHSLPTRKDYIGVFLVSFATLMYELLLTRLFSVVMWYHFAFVAISAALFGMTAGAVGVYLKRDKIKEQGERTVLAKWSLYFGMTMACALFIFLFVPTSIPPTLLGYAEMPMLLQIILPLFTFIPVLLCITIPFIASGVVLALALTHFSSRVGRVYASDLIGAALGCFGVVVMLQLTDGSTSVLFAALVAVLGSCAFAWRDTPLRKTSRIVALALGVVIACSSAALLYGRHPLALIWGKHGVEPKSITEEWNSFSRVSVYPFISPAPFGWGMSDACPEQRSVDQLFLNIDGDAGTVLTNFNGDVSQYTYLGCDVTNIVHYLVPQGQTLVIGAGGGRDVLSALVFGATSVKAVELNGEILKAVNDTFGDFTGHLDQQPGVSFVNDEARSFLTRDSKRYDIIHMSLIDTWAATAAGAFALSENGIYTDDAWSIFLNHLTDHGMLSVSRWYKTGVPMEMYRTVSLASAALKERGVQDPGSHIILVVAQPDVYKNNSEVLGVSTLLVSPSAISSQAVSALDAAALRYHFNVLMEPGKTPNDPVLADFFKGNSAAAYAAVPGNIAPPTDGQPFFFNFIRLSDLFTPSHWQYQNFASLGLLTFMSFVVIALIFLVLYVPYRFAREHITGESVRLAVYFLGIGIGFMAVEIALLQRLSIYFGHPSYALVVVLPALLVSSGLGSMASDLPALSFLSTHKRIVLLAFLLAVAAALFPWFVSVGAAWTTPVRIGVAAALMFPLGFLMGMPFALGMTWATKRHERLTPWLWGLNGVASVAASVLAVLCSLMGGVVFAFVLGIGGYLAAAIAARRGG